MFLQRRAVPAINKSSHPCEFAAKVILPIDFEDLEIKKP